ncbi:hypothetical protein O6H91_08G014700 [Diphasiastrum complanatum]|uniref:Uncharacterized protein n=1 Tax=Diphasiastrum complanatum TaxID=34168 RepID=A0ACC2CV38_DIPCM|nr:hypothetical protein O6H91_08G014700 [Diphasiastrum complanatum]
MQTLHLSSSLGKFFIRCCQQQNNAAQSGKGFGVSTKRKDEKKSTRKKGDESGGHDKKRAVTFKEDSKELRTLLKAVEKEGLSKQPRNLNIDPEVAAKGKVDFVRVESWGEAKDHNDLETLKLKSFSPSYSSLNKSIPLYEQLVRRLQLLDSKGDISVVQARKLPPFDCWSFTEKDYLQFLVDQHAVHEALKDVCTARITSEEADGMLPSLLDLERSKALSTDITALSKEIATTSGLDYEWPKATTQTDAYVKYLNRLGKLALYSSKCSGEAWLHLIAHIFAVHVSHITTGMRIGSKAVECLPFLTRAKAVSFYRDYPLEVKDPTKCLITTFNKLGSQIPQEDDREKIMEELPKAMQKTSLLYSVLAVEQ